MSCESTATHVYGGGKKQVGCRVISFQDESLLLRAASYEKVRNNKQMLRATPTR